MAELRARNADGDLPTFTERRLAAVAEQALRRAGVLGVLPTPLEAVQRVAGVLHRADIRALPPELAMAGRPLLGALWYEARTVYVDLSQSEPRRRFTDAHEAIHALCPWHRAVLRRDGEDELFRATRATIEAEANFGASLLLFQGEAFRRRVGRERCTVALAQTLAEEHGASLQATLHHHVQHHDGEAALVVTGRDPRKDGALPVWTTAQSPAFARAHPSLGPQLAIGIARGTPLREVIEAARTGDAQATRCRSERDATSGDRSPPRRSTTVTRSSCCSRTRLRPGARRCGRSSRTPRRSRKRGTHAAAAAGGRPG